MKTNVLTSIALLAGATLFAQTNQNVVSNSATSATVLTTTTGKTYNSYRLVRVEPDGLVIEYRPEPRALGIAKVDFAVLPPDLQKKYGYDPEAASTHKLEQAEAERRLAAKMLADHEKTSAAIRAREEDNFKGRAEIDKQETQRRQAEAARAQAEAEKARIAQEREAERVRSEKERQQNGALSLEQSEQLFQVWRALRY